MKKLSAVVLFLFACVPFAVAQDVKPTPPQNDEEVVRISTDLIQLDVSVTDKSGKSVSDLRPDEIEIYENGEKQAISNFTFVSGGKVQSGPNTGTNSSAQVAIPHPPGPVKPGQIRRTVALVVDDLTLSYESANLVRKALRKFVEQQMQEGDLLTIVRTGAGSGVLQQFTSDKRLLLASIENVRFNPLGRGRLSAFEQKTDVPGFLKDPKYDGEDAPEEKAFKTAFSEFQESAFGTGTLGTLKFMVSAMRELPGRKSVVLFSDGFSIFQRDEHGFTEGGKVAEMLRLLVEAANRASVVFYTVDARTLQNTDTSAMDSVSLPMNITKSNIRLAQNTAERTKELFDTQGGMDFLAKETGGFAIRNQNNLNDGLERILYDQSYYLVGYQPDTDTFDAKTRKFNKIEIKVKREGVTARYRSGFFAVEDEKLKPVDKVSAARAQTLEQLITSPFAATNIALRLNTIFGNGTSGNYVTPLLNIDARDLKFSDGPDGAKRVVLDLLAMSFGADGVPVDKMSQTVTFDVKPETYSKILQSGFLCHFNFPVKNPGAYQFRVAVRDKQANTVGTASRFIEIPDLKKNKLTMSGILLENFTNEQWGRFAGEIRKIASTREIQMGDDTDPMNDTSLRRFDKNTVLRYGFEIYNSGLGVEKNTGLYTKIRVFRDGQPVLDGPEIPLETSGQNDIKRVKGGGAMNLPRDMPAGDYVLQVIVTERAGKGIQQATTQFVEFEIIG